MLGLVRDHDLAFTGGDRLCQLWKHLYASLVAVRRPSPVVRFCWPSLFQVGFQLLPEVWKTETWSRSPGRTCPSFRPCPFFAVFALCLPFRPSPWHRRSRRCAFAALREHLFLQQQSSALVTASTAFPVFVEDDAATAISALNSSFTALLLSPATGSAVWLCVACACTAQ